MRLENPAPYLRIFVLVGLFCLHAGTTTAQNEREAPSPPSDPWAGKTVQDSSHVIAMMEARIRNAPVVGKQAPKTVVYAAKTSKAVTLAELYETKPVVLFFASYSCMCSQKTAAFMPALAQKYGDEFQFLLIYIREAHPTDGFNTESSGSEFMIADSKALPERAAAALRLSRARNLNFPVFVDSMDDAQAVQWGAWPARLFVVDQKGIVVYAGQQGPWFVKPTTTFDLGMHGVYEPYRNLPGYSRESLEEFLEKKVAR